MFLIEGIGRFTMTTKSDTKTVVKQKLQQPKQFKVLLHNDDFTPRWFVVEVLRIVFAMGESQAMQLMLYVHYNGVGVIGIYPFQMAETKIQQVHELAEKEGFPLQCSMEEE